MGLAHSRHGGEVRAPDGVLRRLPPQCKIVAVFGYAVAVVATPVAALAALAAHLAVVLTLVALGRIGPVFLARRLAVEIPFLAFAAALPFVAAGERVEVAGVAVSAHGLEQAFGLAVRATLGVALVIVLAGTTPVREMLTGLERLGLPPVIVAVTSFMIRYSAVVVDQMRRMGVARRSRAYAPRSLLSSGAIASSLGTLFIRSYERGERVHLAMCSRGYAGTMPRLSPGVRASRGDWAAVAGFVALGSAVATAGALAPGGWGLS
jgi:cobalt/nickel transport system permease protein